MTSPQHTPEDSTAALREKITEEIRQLFSRARVKLTETGWEVIGEELDQTESIIMAAIQEHVAAVIGEDEYDRNDRIFIENELRSEQRRRAGLPEAGDVQH